MSSAKYNVILMRDDRPVRRMRMGRAWLRMFLHLQLLLLALTAAGGYASYTLYTENRQLKSSNYNLGRELNNARMKVERLQNLERMRQAEAGTVLTENGELTRPSVDLVELLSRVDSGAAGVEDVRLSQAPGGLSVDFQLKNLNPDATLNGEVRFSAVARDGRVAPTTANTDELSFSIQRYKRIQTTVALPPDMTEDEVFGVRLVVLGPDGKVLFGALYPLPATGS